MPISPASNLISNLPQAQVIVYRKTFIENLKAETPFYRQCTRIDHPPNSGNQMRLFMYTPLGANTSQAAEGTIGTGVTVAVQNTTATLGEYAEISAYENLAKSVETWIM